MKTKYSVNNPQAGGVCAGALFLLNGSSQAESLFVANFGSGTIYEITPDGT